MVPALQELSSRLLKRLDEYRIAYEETKIYGTPRRLAVMVTHISGKQASITTEVMGPPEKVAFDEKGNPLVPAVKFAEKLGIHINKLVVKETDKGRYLSATVTEKGLSSKTILKRIIPEVILSIPFPKTMRWGGLSIGFARPIQWILAVLGKDAVTFELGNLKSSRYTLGHRFVHKGKIKIQSADEYVDQLKQAHVLCEIDDRKKYIHDEISKAANDINGAILSDAELLDTVTHLVEYPAVCVGRFDNVFLDLPDEILITAMREHQKYFAVTDEKNRLMPNFVVVNNTPAKDMGLVTKGHERVLRARLQDAMFFYEKDISNPFDENVEKLKGVLFQAKLGSMYDKTIRVQKLAQFLTDHINGESSKETSKTLSRKNISRAAWLCKADLVSQVVVEFPKLQGVMGRIYASNENESGEIANAIEEHYRPTYSGGELPRTDTGAVLAIADKMDSICGCFSAGLIPSGASDPYALRRQGIGIIQTILDKDFSLSLIELVKKSVGLYISEDEEKFDDISRSVITFFKDRMANLLAEDGFSKDVISSVIAVSVDDVPKLWEKVRALETLKQAPDFEPIAIAFKRVVNIIKKADISLPREGLPVVDTKLFDNECEHALYKAIHEVGFEVAENLNHGRFEKALTVIASLRSPVDDFFDDVLVMTEDEKIRNNRLAMLGMIASLFEDIADFSKLST